MNRFSVNVAKDGRHWCRIQLPETSEADAIEKTLEIVKMFGDQFDVSLTCWNEVGRNIEI